MLFTAKLRNVSISPQKARLIANLIRDLPLTESLDVLKFTAKKGAKIFLKLLHSVIANAENTYSADIDELRIYAVQVNEGPTYKRVSPRAKGRADRITKRSSHIQIDVSDEEK